MEPQHKKRRIQETSDETSCFLQTLFPNVLVLILLDYLAPLTKFWHGQFPVPRPWEEYDHLIASQVHKNRRVQAEGWWNTFHPNTKYFHKVNWPELGLGIDGEDTVSCVSRPSCVSECIIMSTDDRCNRVLSPSPCWTEKFRWTESKTKQPLCATWCVENELVLLVIVDLDETHTMYVNRLENKQWKSRSLSLPDPFHIADDAPLGSFALSIHPDLQVIRLSYCLVCCIFGKRIPGQDEHASCKTEYRVSILEVPFALTDAPPDWIQLECYADLDKAFSPSLAP